MCTGRVFLELLLIRSIHGKTRRFLLYSPLFSASLFRLICLSVFPVASVSVGIVVNVLAEGAAVVRAVEAAPLAVPVPAAEDAVAVRVQVAIAVPLAAAAQAGAAGVAAVAVALVAG